MGEMTTMTSTEVARFEGLFIPEALTGCWVWVGNQHSKGYGVLSFRGRRIKAHRLSYLHYVGPIPAGLILDHVKARGCATRACVNPDHLEPVTSAVNTLRGDGPTAVNAAKTACPMGHAFEGDNVIARRSGGRACRSCERWRQREKYAARKRAHDVANVVADWRHFKSGTPCDTCAPAESP